MSKVFLRIILGYRLWRILPHRSGPKKNPGAMPHYHRPQSSMRTSKLNAASIIAGISALAALASALFAYNQVRLAAVQLHVAASQTHVATSQVAFERAEAAQAAKLEDLRFVGRVAVNLDEATDQISVVNYSGLPIADAALWTLGITINARGNEQLDTIRAPLTGLGACRTMNIPVASLANILPEKPPETAVGEVYLTFKSPLGLWYTISETVVFETASSNAENAIDASTLTYSDQILGGTVQEGVNEWRTMISDRPLGPAGAVTQFASGDVNIQNNGCIGLEGH